MANEKPSLAACNIRDRDDEAFKHLFLIEVLVALFGGVTKRQVSSLELSIEGRERCW